MAVTVVTFLALLSRCSQARDGMFGCAGRLYFRFLKTEYETIGRRTQWGGGEKSELETLPMTLYVHQIRQYTPHLGRGFSGADARKSLEEGKGQAQYNWVESCPFMKDLWQRIGWRRIRRSVPADELLPQSFCLRKSCTE